MSAFSLRDSLEKEIKIVEGGGGGGSPRERKLRPSVTHKRVDLVRERDGGQVLGR